MSQKPSLTQLSGAAQRLLLRQSGQLHGSPGSHLPLGLHAAQRYWPKQSGQEHGSSAEHVPSREPPLHVLTSSLQEGLLAQSAQRQPSTNESHTPSSSQLRFCTSEQNPLLAQSAQMHESKSSSQTPSGVHRSGVHIAVAVQSWHMHVSVFRSHLPSSLSQIDVPEPTETATAAALLAEELAALEALDEALDETLDATLDEGAPPAPLDEVLVEPVP